MGHGSYTSADWSKLRTSAKITASSTDREIFKQNLMDPRFDPKYINKREARDSEDHPHSTPVMIGLDVTGSMGYLAAQIAKEGLNETMMKLFATKPVEDPQLAFAAIGDINDRAPLQVTQFESDIRIAEQLLALWLEGRGSGLLGCQFLWYFAANYVSADCFEKHHRKGYLFTIGDADCRPTLNTRTLESIFGGNHLIQHDYESAYLAQEAGKKFEVFHIHITRDGRIPASLGKALPGRVMLISRENVAVIPELIVSAMLLTEGMNRNDVLAQWSETARPLVEDAIATLALARKKRGFFF